MLSHDTHSDLHGYALRTAFLASCWFLFSGGCCRTNIERAVSKASGEARAGEMGPVR